MKRVDSLDYRLLYQLDLDSSATYTSIAEKLEVPSETIGFRVRRLVRLGVIKNFRTTIHVSRLNAYYYKLFYKFQHTTPSQEKGIIKYLEQNKMISYLASLDGRYDLTFLIVAKNYLDLKEFLVSFKNKYGSCFFEQEIMTLIGVHRFNLRIFNPQGEALHTRYPENLSSVRLDSLDRSILPIVASNSRKSFSDMAKINGVHENVIRYHIRRLKESAVIGTAVLDINFELLGMIHYQIAIALTNQSITEEIINFALTIPESTFATVTLGKYDLILEFVVAKQGEMTDIIDKIKEKFSISIMAQDIFVLHERSVNWLPSELVA